MATTTDTRREAWDNALVTLTHLNQRLTQAQTHEHDALERDIAAQQDALLKLSAPNIAAVIIKLETMWEGHLHDLDQEADERRLVLEDLNDLSIRISGLIGTHQ